VNQQLRSSTVAELDLALALYRRLILHLFVAAVLFILVAVGLSYLSTALSPPYGVIIGGEDISIWGMLGMLIIMIALLWWDGRAIARVLNDPVGFPLISSITAFIEIGRRAHAMGMEWSGFFGPLRPSRKR